MLQGQLGSWLVGFYADRNGRKSALTWSVTAMCIGSLMIALTPGYASIGVLAPIVLIAARLLQGLSMGGEYGTSETYLSEIAPANRRGFAWTVKPASSIRCTRQPATYPVAPVTMAGSLVSIFIVVDSARMMFDIMPVFPGEMTS